MFVTNRHDITLAVKVALNPIQQTTLRYPWIKLFGRLSYSHDPDHDFYTDVLKSGL